MLPEVLERIGAACDRAGRDRNSVRLVAVTKAHAVDEIRSQVLEYGNFALGENRIQEALPKLEALPDAEWHLIGHLQTNKVKFCRDFKLIHSVDSSRLLEELARRGEGWGRVPPVLLEVNVAREAQKHGLAPEDAAATLKVARDLGITVRGLMTVAPYGDLRVARQAFADLRVARDTLGLEELSMGMSDDYAVAIEEGATMIRIGRLLFAPVPPEEAQ